MMKQLSDYEPYENYYHFVGSAKYRKNLFYSEDIRLSLQKIIQEVLEKKGIEVAAVTVAYNHVHVLLRSELSPSQIGMTLFGASSRFLRQEYPILVQEAEKGLWGGRSWKAIRDEAHLEHCRSYIQRHLPDNTKMDEAI
ncbi:MAG: IS200/IS605 family transposase [Lachnospiraceae bacterium]|nr:IS200/IS605 family transposase [Lachnospiraceae bacterium]